MIYWHVETLEATNLAAYESLLTTEEALVFARLPHGARRAEWLRGRAVAKQLLQRYLLTQAGAAPDASTISILPNAAGAPQVTVNGARLPVALSISHSGDAAFCALTSAADGRVGVDMEGIAPRDEAFLRDFFSNEEQAFVREQATHERDTFITAIWCAKEAYYKALGTGLPLETRAIICIPARAPGDWAPVRIEGASAGAWQASWRSWRGYVLVLVAG